MPLEFEARTVPLVNLRFWLEELEDAGLIGAVERRVILRNSRAIFYANRTAESQYRLIGRILGDDRLKQIAAAGFGEISDVKADDARLALAFVAGIDVSIDRKKVRSS